MSEAGERSPDSTDRGGIARDRDWAELQQQILREEVQRRKEFRGLFETYEKVIAEKVRQLRTERGWSQEDLARRMEELGWPMHQTTVTKLEAAKRPIRAAEVYALAMVFGLPIQALWYLPVPGEPRSLTQMREDLKRIDDSIANTEQSLKTLFGFYADQQSDRLRLSRVMNEAAKSGLDAVVEREYDPEGLSRLAAVFSAGGRTAKELADMGISEVEALERGKVRVREDEVPAGADDASPRSDGAPRAGGG